MSWIHCRWKSIIWSPVNCVYTYITHTYNRTRTAFLLSCLSLFVCDKPTQKRKKEMKTIFQLIKLFFGPDSTKSTKVFKETNEIADFLCRTGKCHWFSFGLSHCFEINSGLNKMNCDSFVMVLFVLFSLIWLFSMVWLRYFCLIFYMNGIQFKLKTIQRRIPLTKIIKISISK